MHAQQTAFPILSSRAYQPRLYRYHSPVIRQAVVTSSSLTPCMNVIFKTDGYICAYRWKSTPLQADYPRVISTQMQKEVLQRPIVATQIRKVMSHQRLYGYTIGDVDHALVALKFLWPRHERRQVKRMMFSISWCERVFSEWLDRSKAEDGGLPPLAGYQFHIDVHWSNGSARAAESHEPRACRMTR